jgi:hypothetical protein
MGTDTGQDEQNFQDWGAEKSVFRAEPLCLMAHGGILVTAPPERSILNCKNRLRLARSLNEAAHQLGLVFFYAS